jgi:hemoglobin/transferrin/lactoferrin receptor protein
MFLVDGIRLPEAYKFSSYYNFDQGSYVDFNTLSSVEILKGPASALYGADALGGLVSYRTIKPKDLLKNDKKNAVEIPFNYDSSNNGLTESIKIATKLSDKTSLALVYTKEDAEETKVKADSQYIDDVDFSGNNYLANLTYDFDDFTSGSLIYENLSRNTTSTSTTENLSAMSSAFATYTSLKSDDKINRDRLSVEYEYDNPDNDKLFKFFSNASIL